MSTKNITSFEDRKFSENAYTPFHLNYQLYPPVQDFYDMDGQFEIYNDKKRFPMFLNNGLKEEINSNTQENVYEINEDFFGSLLGKNNYELNKEKKINTISKIIRKSKLMEKLEKEYNSSNKKLDLNALSTMCAKNLSFMELKKGRVLFKVGDKGDRFYFILGGKITVLKPREVYCKMNLYEYLFYLLILIKEKEDFLFNDVILNNCTLIPITAAEEVKSLYRIFFLLNLKTKLENGTIDNNRLLKIFFDKNYQSFNEYNLDINILEILEQKKLKSGNKQWNIYILQNCSLSKGDFRTLGRYKDYNEKKNLKCFVYDSILYLGPGFFFGDAALEVKVNKRNATIRAEEETILGFLKSVDYSNMIAPQRKIEKMKEINFLINNFFFKNINISIFEKNIFHLFTLNENKRGTILINCDTMPKFLFFIKEGNLSLTLNSSIKGINSIIENICKNIIKNYSDELIKKKIIEKEELNILKGYQEEDKILSNLKPYTKEFVQEINKIRTFHIAVFSGKETIGLEEIFLDIPYICDGIVTSEKLIYYKLSIEQLKSILFQNHHINFFYIKSAVNKVFSFIERLKNLKQNNIDIAKMRYENQSNFRINNLPSLKNNNKNINLNQQKNNKEIYSDLVENKSFSKVGQNLIKLSRNISTEIKRKEKEFQILSYTDNKSNKLDKQYKYIYINKDIDENNLIYKSPLLKVPQLKNKIFLSILLGIKKENKSGNEKSHNNNKTNNNSNELIKVKINNNNNSKFSDFISSLRKARKNSMNSLKLNTYIKKREDDSVKYSSRLDSQKRLVSALNNKSDEAIKIGDKFMTLDGLRKKIGKSDCGINEKKKLLKIIQSNIYYYENQKNLNTNPSIESEQNSFEKESTKINLNREKSSLIRSQDINDFHLSFVPLMNEDEEKNEFTKRINNNTNSNINNNKNDNSLLINKSNINKEINKTSQRVLKLGKNLSFNYKSKKIILQKLLLNKKSMSNKIIFNKNENPININENIKNDSKIKPTINNIDISHNNSNLKNSMKMLPSISRKNLFLKNTNDLKNKKLINAMSQKELIPEIIRNFYNDKKMKGYVSIIPNKESNTLFLRKYHKKYKKSEQENSKSKK